MEYCCTCDYKTAFEAFYSSFDWTNHRSVKRGMPNWFFLPNLGTQSGTSAVVLPFFEDRIKRRKDNEKAKRKKAYLVFEAPILCFKVQAFNDKVNIIEGYRETEKREGEK